MGYYFRGTRECKPNSFRKNLIMGLHFRGGAVPILLWKNMVSGETEFSWGRKPNSVTHSGQLLSKGRSPKCRQGVKKSPQIFNF